MKNIILFAFCVGSFYCNSQITLTHNVGDNFIGTSIYGCSDTGLRWSRVFNLSDFGITENLELNSVTTAMRVSDVNGIHVEVNIYEVDENFPDSFDESNLIDSSQEVDVFYQGDNHALVQIDFDEIIVVPQGTEMILVEIKQTEGDVVFLSGTANDNDLSWFKSDASGCNPSSYTSTVGLGRPDARFYIKAIGEEVLSVSDFDITKITLYPNPTADIIEISGVQESEIYSFTIYDVNGRLLLQKMETSKVNIASYPGGIYFAEVKLASGFSETRKIVKR